MDAGADATMTCTGSCTPYACGPTACKFTCTANTDCAAGNFCWLNACVKLTDVSAGYKHTCARTTTGNLQCWGYNGNGQLGDNSTTDRLLPVAVMGLSTSAEVGTATAAVVATGWDHTCALTTGGGVKCWGNNTWGQLGNSSTTESHVPVAVSGLSSGVVSIVAGNDNTCALTTGGGVQCWGYNVDGELGTTSTMMCAGVPCSVVPVPVSGLSSGVTAITEGAAHACAVMTGGGVVCWGFNNAGQLGNNSTTGSFVPVAVSGLQSGATAISAGGTQTCALTTGGGVQCWGYNANGQLGTNTTMMCAGQPCSLVPVAVSGLSPGIAAISTRYYHTCVLTTGGAAECWGLNGNGQLGNNSMTDSFMPVAVSGFPSGIAAISAGGYHTCVLTTGGGAECWGSNSNGQLGNNSMTDSLAPVNVLEP